MFPLIAAAAAVIPALYVLRQIILRDFGLLLRWPVLLVAGVLMWATMMFVVWPPIVARIEWLQAARSYPDLVFVLVLCIVTAVSYLLRPWRSTFYRRLH